MSEEAAKFLNRIFADTEGWIELRALGGAERLAREPCRHWISSRDWHDEGPDGQLARGNLWGWITSRGHTDIYVGVAPRANKWMAKKEGVPKCRWVFADFDPGQTPNHTGLPAPSLVVSSGRGTHYYWELSEELARESWEHLMARIPILLGSDAAVKDITRIMRLPGTINSKNGENCTVTADTETVHGFDTFFRAVSGVTTRKVREENPYSKKALYEDGQRNSGMYGELVRIHSACGDDPMLFRQTAALINERKFSPPLSPDELEELVRKVADGRPFEAEPTTPALVQTFGLDANKDATRKIHPVEIFRLMAPEVAKTARYIPERAEWIVWDGKRKVWSNASGAVAPVLDACALLEDRLEDIGNAEAAKQCNRLHAGATTARGSKLTLSEIEGEHILRASDADSDRWLVVAKNGVYIDLKTGHATEVDKEKFVTTTLGAEFEPEAECPEFMKFLERVQPDPVVRSYLRQSCFYLLTGQQDKRAFFIHQGVGANGKSVFWRVIMRVMGELAKRGNVKLLCPTRNSDTSHDASLTGLLGKRLAVYEELKDQDELSGSMVKRLSSGDDMITARPIHCAETEIPLTAKQVIVTNQTPKIQTDDSALIRRLVMVNWGVVIPQDEEDTELGSRIISKELPGVLNWILSGRSLYMENGLLPEPAPLAEFKASALADMNPMLGLVSEYVTYSEFGSVSLADLRKAFMNYAPSYPFPETRSVPRWIETFAATARDHLKKSRREVMATKLSAWKIRGISLDLPGESIV